MSNDNNYYRICFRGVVSLVTRPDLNAPKSGHYLSYGDIIATSSREQVVEIPSLQEGPSCQPLSSSASNRSVHNHPATSRSRTPVKRRQRVTFVRVDQILTSGESPNSQQIPTSSPSTTPTKSTEMKRRYTGYTRPATLFSIRDSDGNNENDLSFAAMESSSKLDTSCDLNVSQLSAVVGPEDDDASVHEVPSSRDDENDHYYDGKESEYTSLGSVISTMPSHDENLSPASKRRHSSSFGYLMTCRPAAEQDERYSANLLAAEPCMPPLLHEQGSFLYRVCSSHSVATLNGSAIDAPPTKTVLKLFR